jgi:HEPN domain-containing protein
MNERRDSSASEARRWLRQADEDLLAARRLAADADLPSRIACFLSHLAAEKMLKAYLISRDVPFPKSHDLADLGSLVQTHAELRIADADLRRLNPWSIEGRYPGDIPDATRTQAEMCIQSAERVAGAVHSSIDDQPST